MRLRPEEPPAGLWRAVPITELVATFLDAADDTAVISIDGRSSSGKTTLAGRIAHAAADAAVVHTDDIAWSHSRFGWVDLIVDGVLTPFRSGRAVSFRPPAWETRAREGAVEVAAEKRLLIIEGVGSSRRDLAPLFDATVWVQCDEDVMAERNTARVAIGETTAEGLAGWLSEEVPFLAGDRPWERATVIVAGSPDVAYDPRSEVVVAS